MINTLAINLDYTTPDMTTDLFSLGDLYVSDFLALDEVPRADPFPLQMQMDGDGLVHLAAQPPAELMWGRYWYRSGVNQTMRFELHDIVMAVEQVVGYDVWVDIASNDGTLLSYVSDEAKRVGVDPADDSFRVECERHADLVVQEPFTLDVADRIVDKYGPADVVTCAAMFYDLMDPGPFLWAVRQMLAADGVFVIQLAYAPLMLRQLAFDAICHEHARYYSLTTLTDTLRAFGFQVLDAELNTVNGGSLRVFATHEIADVRKIGSQPWRDVGQFRLDALLAEELWTAVNTPDPWMAFWHAVNVLAADVSGFLTSAARRGDKVWGYGASTKGNTLLQFFGLDSSLIQGIAERQPQKYGLRTVGTDIPIWPESAMRAAHPEYALVLPWQFLTEFTKREAAYLAAGGKLVVPCPRFEVIG